MGPPAGCVRVKICGITRPEDAVAAVRAGADAVGVVCAPSPRRVTEAVARLVADAARAEASGRGRAVDVFGLFVDEEAVTIRRVAGEAGLDVIQLHGDETAEAASALAGLRLVRAVRVRGRGALEAVRAAASSGLFEAVLLDAYVERVRGGSGTTFDWGVAAEAARDARIILAGGLTPQNVGEAVRRGRPYMVDVSSGVERAPGIKDHDLLVRFVEAARAAGVP